MKKKALFMAVLLAVVGLLAGVAASDAFGNAGGYTITCGMDGFCHGIQGPKPTVTLQENNGMTATYSVVAPNAFEWAVFNGNTRVGGSAGEDKFPGSTATGGTFTVPVGATYTIWAIYGVADGAVSGANTTVSPAGVTTYTITPTAGPNGSISPATPQTVTSGSNVTFTITPAAGYVVDDVLVNGTSVGAVTSYTFQNVTGNGTISATFKTAPLVTYTITTTAGPNGTITPAGPQTVAEHEDVTFAITPSMNYYVETLKVDGQFVAPTRSYTFKDVTANHTIEATFAASPAVCTITSSVEGTGGVISSPPLAVWSVPRGGTITYYFTPDPGYHVDEVTVNGWPVEVDPDDDSYTFASVDRNNVLVAKFARNTYTVEASKTGNGTITPAGAQTVLEGEDITFTITPDAGNSISDVVVDGVSVGVKTSYTFTDVTEDHTIQAKFVANAVNYTITSSVTGTGGAISPYPLWVVPRGGTITFWFLPNTGYQVQSVTVDGAAVDADEWADDYSYSFWNVQANHTIAVAFAPIPTYTITPTAGANGSISPDTAQTVTEGDDVSFTITPDAGYRVQDVKVDGTSVGAVTSYEFTDVSANHTIAATFAKVKVKCTLKLKASAKQIKRNKAIKLTATLKGSAGYQNAKVRLEVKVGKKAWKLLKNVKVNAKGVATYKYKVKTKGTLKYRAKFAGNAAYLAAKTTPALKLVVK